MSSPSPSSPRSNNTPLILAVVAIGVVVLGIVGVLAVAVLGGVLFYVERPLTPVAPVPIAVPSSSSVATRILSTPDGARVYRDGVFQCVAPCDVYSGAGETLTLELRADGYEDYTMTVQAGTTNGALMTARMP